MISKSKKFISYLFYIYQIQGMDGLSNLFFQMCLVLYEANFGEINQNKLKSLWEVPMNDDPSQEAELFSCLPC